MRKDEGQGLRMARINTVGLTELANDLQKEGNIPKETIRRMLEEGAEKLAEGIKSAASNEGLRKTGKMIDSIKPGNLQLYSDSAQVEIWPQGTRKNGRKRERNAVVGFVQHYGRSYRHKKRPGTLFFEKGEALGADAAVELMAKIFGDGE